MMLWRFLRIRERVDAFFCTIQKTVCQCCTMCECVLWECSRQYSGCAMYYRCVDFLTSVYTRFQHLRLRMVGRAVGTTIAGTVQIELSASRVPSLPAGLVWASHRGEGSHLRGWICISWTCSRSWEVLGAVILSKQRYISRIFHAELVLMKH